MGEDEKKTVTVEQLRLGLQAYAAAEAAEQARKDAMELAIRAARTAAFEYQHKVYLLVFVAKEGAKIMGWTPEMVDRLRSKPNIEEWWAEFLGEAAGVANAEKDGDFPQLHGFGAVWIWTGLEDAINTLLELYVRHQPHALESPKLKDLKVDLVEYLRLSEGERAEFIVGQLQNKVGSSMKEGLGIFESVLDMLGIKCEVDKPTRNTLYELHKVRNCVVHRKGIADRRLVTDCPFLNLRVGDPVRTTSDRFEEYFTAADRYIKWAYGHVLGEPLLAGGLEEALRLIGEAKVEPLEEEETVELTDAEETPDVAALGEVTPPAGQEKPGSES